ncbi:olfactory receptor 10A6-like [Ctenopharyngodon idella]|uniref:olfactory receptor 10A6-like n=1 Tax=Ctenopharyngodon idella TaxID=7959 RepID=UPI00222FF232|nr:olfactory receptor 10A6-like [Ctenopharyngodon idella]
MSQSTKLNISFILNAYNRVHELKYVFIVMLFLLYTIIITANVLIIYVTYIERKLHKPMYFFICNMACINLYGGVAFTWIFPFFRFSIIFSLTANIDICGIIIEKVYCDNYSVVKLSCSDITYINIIGTTMIFFSIVLPFFIIFYSYLRIIFICLKLSKKGRDKLFSTCVPHLMALLNFIIGSSFELLQSRFDMRHYEKHIASDI